MTDNPYAHQDDPTEPTIRRPPTPPQGQQGKLIIGSFQDGPNSGNRKPYQYPHGSNLQSGQSGQPGWQNRPVQSQAGTYQSRQQLPQNQQIPAVAPVPPTSAPNGPQYPYHQPGQTPGTGSPTATKKGRRPRRRGCMVGCLVVLLLFCILLGTAGVLGQRVLAFGSAISTQSPLSTQTGYMNTSDRVNILILGYGGAGHDGAYLTDSMMVMSLIPSSHHTTLISVPRDLWVQVPAGSGNEKINAIYENASNNINNTNPVAGGDATAQEVSSITGLDIKYWLTINFAGFKAFIDSIGGIDVYVPDSFSAHYPANDDPSINPNWITVHFTKGMAHMNGTTAIIYARARYVYDNPAESTDFARSARQQIIMKAALAKMKSISTWPSMYSALSALEKTIYTNLSLADLAQFALKMDLNNAHHVGLSNQNVLMDSTSADGQYILLPQSNNWQLIKDYIKQQLYT